MSNNGSARDSFYKESENEILVQIRNHRNEFQSFHQNFENHKNELRKDIINPLGDIAAAFKTLAQEISLIRTELLNKVLTTNISPLTHWITIGLLTLALGVPLWLFIIRGANMKLDINKTGNLTISSEEANIPEQNKIASPFIEKTLP